MSFAVVGKKLGIVMLSKINYIEKGKCWMFFAFVKSQMYMYDYIMCIHTYRNTQKTYSPIHREREKERDFSLSLARLSTTKQMLNTINPEAGPSVQVRTSL